MRARKTRRAKRNPASPQIDPGLGLPDQKIRQGVQQYDDWHWGISPDRVLNWDDPDTPEMLIECGRLVGLHIRLPDGASYHRSPRRERDTRVEFSPKVSEQSHIAYDPNHPHQRLYLLLSSTALPVLATQFWTKNGVAPMDLNEAAVVAGGRHGEQMDYPHVQVKTVGILTALIYFTHKQGDGPSYYIHKMGEKTHFYPVLCADAGGRLWIAGGSYTSPTVGITD